MESLDINQEIVTNFKAGQSQAFDLIVTFYQKPIYSHLYRLVNNKEDALDLTQDTFVKIYKNRKNVDLDKNFKSWLYKIATNIAYDWLKKQKKLPISKDFDDLIEFETIKTNSQYYSIEQLNNLDLEEALKSLKPVQENSLRLYYQQGFTYVEIGEILQLPLNTVKTHIARAKAELLKKINRS